MTEKEIILRDLDHARAAIHLHMGETSREWHPKALVSRSIENYRWVWVAGAVVAGVLMVRAINPLRSRKNERDISGKVATNRTLAALVTSPLIGMAKKAAFTLIASRIKDLFPAPAAPPSQSPTEFR